ncbi:MAG TPA: hypothetical protein DGT21_06575 [Armatimonadetes bacterium]|jgi:histidyl-tRNA synthetase|nr:hypothetical protein [Armatimonadota bacterium]
MRERGIRADVDLRRRSMKAQLRHADRERFATAAIIGDDELARGVVALRDMETGEQLEVANAELWGHLK